MIYFIKGFGKVKGTNVNSVTRINKIINNIATSIYGVSAPSALFKTKLVVISC